MTNLAHLMTEQTFRLNSLSYNAYFSPVRELSGSDAEI